MVRPGAHLKVPVLFGGPLAQPEKALVGPDEDGVDVAALEVGVQRGRHRGVRRLAVAVDEAALHGESRDLPCTTTSRDRLLQCQMPSVRAFLHKLVSTCQLNGLWDTPQRNLPHEQLAYKALSTM